MMSFITQSLLRMASDPVGGILSQLAQLVKEVDVGALNPIQAMVQQVTNGIWIGEGANAFIEEASNLMLPGIGQISDQIGIFSSNLRFARDRIERADEEVNRRVKTELFDVFGFY